MHPYSPSWFSKLPQQHHPKYSKSPPFRVTSPKLSSQVKKGFQTQILIFHFKVASGIIPDTNYNGHGKKKKDKKVDVNYTVRTCKGKMRKRRHLDKKKGRRLRKKGFRIVFSEKTVACNDDLLIRLIPFSETFSLSLVHFSNRKRLNIAFA